MILLRYSKNPKQGYYAKIFLNLEKLNTYSDFLSLYIGVGASYDHCAMMETRVSVRYIANSIRDVLEHL